MNQIEQQSTEMLPCGHPRSALYFSKYGLEEGECVDCGAAYTRAVKLANAEQEPLLIEQRLVDAKQLKFFTMRWIEVH